MRALFLALGTLLIPSVIANDALAAEPESYDVDARIDRGASTVRVDERVRVRVAPGEREVRLWLYGDRVAVAPRTLDERTWRWIFPGDADYGGLTASDVRVDGAPVDARVDSEPAGFRARGEAGSDLIVPVSHDGIVEIALHLDIRVPARFGRFGRDGSVISLAGPWYAIVVSDDDAWRFDARQNVHVTASDGELFVGDQVFGAEASVERVGPYVPVLSAPHFDLWRDRVAGVEVAWASFEALPRMGRLPTEDLAAIDRISLAQRVVRDVVTTARWLGVPLPPRITLLTVPSRTELAATAPGIVLVSDRWAQIFPVDIVREFHLRALRRALFASFVEDVSELRDPPADRGWAQDLRAVALTDLDEARRANRAQRPEDLLQLFSFHPAVDQLIYAPQIAFEDVYFGAIDEPDPYRDDPNRARVPVTRGRRILESAREVLGPERFERFVARVVLARGGVRAALTAIDPLASARLPTWLSYPMLEVNYRLGAIDSREVDGGWEHTVEVFRDGAARREPVEVQVDADSDERVVGIWDADGARGEVVVRTRGARRSVTVDPRQRLPQSATIADGHPRLDDATDVPWRPPLLQGFAFELLGSEGDFTGYVDVALRRRYDLEHTVALRLFRTASRRTGGEIRYLQGVGPKVHTNRRAMTAGAGIGFYRVDPGFSGNSSGAWAGDVALTLALDTRRYLYDWREGVSLLTTVTGTTTVADDGTAGVSARGAVRGTAAFPIGVRHVLVLAGGAGLTIAPVVANELQSIGGPTTLRGFTTSELLGTSGLYAVLEHRFTLIPDLAMNVLHVAWVREVQLAWWVGGGVVIGAQDGREFVGAGEAGAGVRFHYEYGGVQPGVMRLDFGVPVSRLAQGVSENLPPLSFYLAFEQYY